VESRLLIKTIFNNKGARRARCWKGKTKDRRGRDIFGPMEEGGSNEENVKDEEKEKEAKEEHEEGQEKEDDSRSSEEEEEEVEDDERDNDPWNPLRRKKGEDLKEPFMKEVQQFLDRGKTQDYAGNAAFNTQLPASR